MEFTNLKFVSDYIHNNLDEAIKSFNDARARFQMSIRFIGERKTRVDIDIKGLEYMVFIGDDVKDLVRGIREYFSVKHAIVWSAPIGKFPKQMSEDLIFRVGYAIDNLVKDGVYLDETLKWEDEKVDNMLQIFEESLDVMGRNLPFYIQFGEKNRFLPMRHDEREVEWMLMCSWLARNWCKTDYVMGHVVPEAIPQLGPRFNGKIINEEFLKRILPEFRSCVGALNELPFNFECFPKGTKLSAGDQDLILSGLSHLPIRPEDLDSNGTGTFLSNKFFTFLMFQFRVEFVLSKRRDVARDICLYCIGQYRVYREKFIDEYFDHIIPGEYSLQNDFEFNLWDIYKFGPDKTGTLIIKEVENGLIFDGPVDFLLFVEKKKDFDVKCYKIPKKIPISKMRGEQTIGKILLDQYRLDNSDNKCVFDTTHYKFLAEMDV